MRHVEHHAQRIQTRYHVPTEVGHRRAGEGPPSPYTSGWWYCIAGCVARTPCPNKRSTVSRPTVCAFPVRCTITPTRSSVGGASRSLRRSTRACRRAAAHRVHHVRDAAYLVLQHPGIGAGEVVVPWAGLEVAAESNRGHQRMHAGRPQFGQVNVGAAVRGQHLVVIVYVAQEDRQAPVQVPGPVEMGSPGVRGHHPNTLVMLSSRSSPAEMGRHISGRIGQSAWGIRRRKLVRLDSWG